MKHRPIPLLDLLPTIAERLVPPVCIALGSPARAACIAGRVSTDRCWQMDLVQAERLESELARDQIPARVVTSADLWDLPAEFQTVVYPIDEGGERELKLDVVEQAYHVLKPRGCLVVLSPYLQDDLFPAVLKKTFGKSHIPIEAKGQVIWAQRGKDHPRRRHEVTFHANVAGDGPLPFLSRPGVFTYGRMDVGARALLEVAKIRTGDRILDLGCGCGTNGIFAGRRAGPTGRVTFIDSNLRAVALAEHNARTHALPNFEVLTAVESRRLQPGSFDVVLANPPYYAQDSIAQAFIDQALPLLRPRGRFYLVTKKWETVGPMAAECFGRTEVMHVRDYGVVVAEAPGSTATSGLRE